MHPSKFSRYDGEARVYHVNVVATALEVRMPLIEQPDDGSGWGEAWCAWLPAECVQP